MLVAILVCIVKAVKLLVDIVIIVLFLRFIMFFLNLRKLEQRKITLFNQFILLIVMILYALTIYQSLFIFGLLIFYVYPDLNTSENFLMQMINLNIFYVKDFFISLMLSYLFYFKGMQQNNRVERRKQESVISGQRSINYTKSKGLFSRDVTGNRGGQEEQQETGKFYSTRSL